ncbi:hypothetical protein AGMMS49942_28110 [Spirochaetia bacterium]|nr:hypothetical protein AGMMS49942_28110 [Spirochaetia bacterium]
MLFEKEREQVRQAGMKLDRYGLIALSGGECKHADALRGDFSNPLGNDLRRHGGRGCSGYDH